MTSLLINRPSTIANSLYPVSREKPMKHLKVDLYYKAFSLNRQLNILSILLIPSKNSAQSVDKKKFDNYLTFAKILLVEASSLKLTI